MPRTLNEQKAAIALWDEFAQQVVSLANEYMDRATDDPGLYEQFRKLSLTLENCNEIDLVWCTRTPDGIRYTHFEESAADGEFTLSSATTSRPKFESDMRKTWSDCMFVWIEDES